MRRKWFYVLIIYEVMILLYSTVFLTILLRSMGRIILFEDIVFRTTHFYVVFVPMVFLSLVLLITYFIIGKNLVGNETEKIKGTIGIIGFTLSLIAAASFLFQYANLILWVSGAGFSLAGVELAFSRNNVPRLALAGCVISFLTQFLLPYYTIQLVPPIIVY